jgi:D-arginine dehydrogenase
MTDVIVIGGGIAGAAAAAFLSARADVVLLEREAVLAHHTTGRSAAQYIEHYGGPVNERLTVASRAFFTAPPDDWAATPLVSPRAALNVGTAADLDALAAETKAGGSDVVALSALETRVICPALRPEWVAGGVIELGALDIDVAALHQGFVGQARRNGASIVVSAGVRRLERDRTRWHVFTDDDQFEADVIVNAAGAWGDEIATLAGVRPIGLQPLRRTAFTVAAPPDSGGWPLVHAVDGAFYFKPESAGQLLCSPADETPSPPCDVRPEEIDVARAIDHINEATTLAIRHVRSQWAGLRTFTPDRAPVLGFDDGVDGFMWHVGQGGTGIQTAPAAGRAVASLVLDGRLPDDLGGLTTRDLAPRR